MMCADGFLPVVVENEPSRMVDVENEELEASVNYFTCCLPPRNESTELSSAEDNTTTTTTTNRHCSDPITADDEQSLESRCESQESRKFPRRMKSHWVEDGTEIESFVCCDSNISHQADSNNVTAAKTILDQAECLPYWDDSYAPALVKNELGLIRPVACIFSDGDFAFPRPISNDQNQQFNALGEYRYQCCRTGPALPPYVNDRKFQQTLYPALALYVIAITVSIIVAAALLIPFLKELRNGGYRQRTSELVSSRQAFRRSMSRNVTTRSNREPRYSTYNLYLVHLSLLDLAYSVFQVVMLVLPAKQYYVPVLFEWIVEFPHMDNKTLTADFLVSSCYGLTNMGINVIVCHEVLVLLKASKKTKKIQGPSSTRVNQQVGVVVLLSFVCGISLFYANVHFPDNETRLILILATVALVLFSYLFFVTITLWKNGYLHSLQHEGSSPSEKGLRQLALYFFRIVGVFMLIWIPCAVITLCIWFEKDIASWDLLVVFWLMALQPTLTFCMILTKDDAKNYIVDFVTFSYCQRKQTVATPEKRMRYSSVGGISSTATNNSSSWPNKQHHDDEVGNDLDGGDDCSEEGEGTSSFGFLIPEDQTGEERCEASLDQNVEGIDPETQGV